MKIEKKEVNSEALDYRIYVNENFAKYDFDEWLIEQLNLVPGLSVLDLGCGTGKHLFKISGLVGNVGQVVGLDISEDSLMKCKKKIGEIGVNNIKVHKSDLTTIKESVNTKFDRILSSFAIYYTKDENKTFKDCYEILNENGFLFFCGPARGNNAAFLELIERAGGKFSKEFIKWSNFLESKAVPVLKKIFGNMAVMTFENPIEFPDADTLFNYWKATAMYDQNIEKSIKKTIKDEFKKSDVFINKKIVIGLRCKK